MITANMVRSDRNLAIFLHREMWAWIADNPGKYKNHWPRWAFNGGDVQEVDFLCFACVLSRPLQRSGCHRCVFNWPSEVKEYMCESLRKIRDGDGLFTRFSKAYSSEDYDNACQFARAIANLPENKEFRR